MASHPSSTGKLISMSTISGCCWAAIATPCAPSTADQHLVPLPLQAAGEHIPVHFIVFTNKNSSPSRFSDDPLRSRGAQPDVDVRVSLHRSVVQLPPCSSASQPSSERSYPPFWKTSCTLPSSHDRSSRVRSFAVTITTGTSRVSSDSSKRSQHLEAVHSRHHQVEQYDGRLRPRYLIQDRCRRPPPREHSIPRASRTRRSISRVPGSSSTTKTSVALLSRTHAAKNANKIGRVDRLGEVLGCA